MITEISNSVCAPVGFTATGIHCGLKKNKDKKDLALIYCDKLCECASVYTTNAVKGAPIIVTKENIKNGKAQAVFCNSRNANTCNKDGIAKAEMMCEYISKELKIDKTDVVVASTGVIGQPLPIEPIKNACKDIVAKLCKNGGSDACQAMMTTDTFVKEVAVKANLSNSEEIKIGAIAKGSGMIHPNMATMLCFITTDVNISSEMLQKALKTVSDDTFNMLSVDGDTSTNDMLSILASGYANATKIDCDDEDYKIFVNALHYVCRKIVKMMAKDGEGATKLLVCKVKNAKDKRTAKVVAKTVISSNLFKAAMFGEDANWGRVLCAIGYSDTDLDIEKIDVMFKSQNGEILVCENGYGLDFSEEKAKNVLESDEIDVIIDLKSGEYTAESYGCDLTYDYVKINGDYRT